MTNRLFARSSSLVSRPLYTRATLPGVWRYRLSPFSTGSGVSCNIPSTQPQTRFPNYLLQGVSDASALEKRKQMVESSFASILERLEIFYIDPQSNTLARQGFFEQLDRVVCKMDPGAKVYLSGGNIRNLFGYLYEEIRFAQNQTTDQILKGILTKEFSFRDETNGKIPKMAALGVGSDLDILIEFSPDFDAEKKRAVINAVYKFMNRVGKGAKASLIKRTLLPVPDVKEYSVQIQRATRQGGSPLDWLAFPITPRSGSQLRTPSHLPDLVDKILKGDLDFFPVTQAEDPAVTTARLFRSIIEVPYLQITEESYCEVERSIERLGQSSSNSEVLKKVSYVFERAMQNIRLPEASNRFVMPDEGDKIAKILHKAVRNLPLREKNLPVLPEILPQKSIEGRSLDHDPGDLRKNGLLMPLDTFVAKYTDNGILYHGIPNKDAMLPMLRGSLVVSTNQQDRPQGRAAYGRGFYTTRIREIAQSYSGQQGFIVSFQVNRSPKLRVIDLSRLGRVELANLSDAAKAKNKDLHEYLSQELDVDIIVADTEILLIQNAKAFRIERTVEANARLFFDIVCSIGSVELFQLALSQNIISQAEIEKAFFNASSSGYKEIVEILLKKGSISEEARGEAIIVASKNGCQEIVKILLHNDPITEKARTLAMYYAALNGHKEIVQIFLDNGSITDEARGQATCHAAEKGYKEIVEILLAKGPITVGKRSIATSYAALNGHKEIIEILLAKGPILIKVRGESVIIAAEMGYKEIVEILLDNGPITKKNRGSAASSAAEKGFKEIVEILLDNGPISDEKGRDIILGVAESGHTNILEILLKFKPISEEYMEWAIFTTIRYGLSGFLKILLQNRAISERLHEKAVVEAVRYGQQYILEILINNRPISDTAHQRAVVMASENNYPMIVEILLDNSSVTEEARGLAMYCAAENGSMEVVKILLKNGSVSNTAREKAIVISAYEGYQEIVEILLNIGPISDQAREAAIINSSVNGHHQIVNTLLNNGVISKELYWEATAGAVEEGFEEVVKILLSKSGPIPDEYMKRAIFNAIRHDHKDCLKILLQKRDISKPLFQKAVAEASRIGRKDILVILINHDYYGYKR